MTRWLKYVLLIVFFSQLYPVHAYNYDVDIISKQLIEISFEGKFEGYDELLNSFDSKGKEVSSLREKVQVGSFFTFEVGLVATKRLKDRLPQIDGTGKLHGKLPHIKDLKNLDKRTLSELRDDLRNSLKRRKQVTKELGPDAGHSRREAAEEGLLKSLDKFLGG